ncbi:MAG: sugar ABC transporter permease [Treponema sp.]|jgi:raffinose/stachyose/melibiose transport system permease protein|nr:sugar ABC transporter permease [Treponema sp.]
MQKDLKKYVFLFTLPVFVAFAVAFLIPFFLGIYLSFTQFTTVTDSRWTGLSNYIKAFADDKTFLNSLWFTVKFAVVSVISVNLVAFCLALLLTRKIRGTNLFRTIFFMPNLIGGIVLGYIWQLILNGILYPNATLTTDPKYGFWGLVILMNWQMVGYMMIIYIASIQNVSEDLLDAARVDGASPLQVLRNVIIPMVMPAITICLFLTLTNSFKLFDQNLSLTAGAPSRQSEMLALNIYNTFFGSVHSEGIGQAKAVVFSLLVSGIVLIQLKLTSRKEVTA